MSDYKDFSFRKAIIIILLWRRDGDNLLSLDSGTIHSKFELDFQIVCIHKGTGHARVTYPFGNCLQIAYNLNKRRIRDPAMNAMISRDADDFNRLKSISKCRKPGATYNLCTTVVLVDSVIHISNDNLHIVLVQKRQKAQRIPN